jgi:hypothetical protein
MSAHQYLLLYEEVAAVEEPVAAALLEEVAAVAALLEAADILALVFDPLLVDNTEAVKAVEAVEATTLEAVKKKMTFYECSLPAILARMYVAFPQDSLLNFYAF